MIDSLLQRYYSCHSIAGKDCIIFNKPAKIVKFSGMVEVEGTGEIIPCLKYFPFSRKGSSLFPELVGVRCVDSVIKHPSGTSAFHLKSNRDKGNPSVTRQQSISFGVHAT